MRSCLTLLLCCLLCILLGSEAADLPTPSQRIELAPSPLPALLASIPGDDHGQRWELANVALEVLLEAYRETLLESTNEAPRTSKARAKLARWQRATRSMIEEVESRRQQLLIGSTFSVFADGRGQVFVTVDGNPLALTGFGRDDDRVVQTHILERYCAYNPCPEEAARPPAAEALLPAGHWQIDQGRPPLFNAGARLRCRFTDLTRREAKTRMCREVAAEMARLDKTLTAVAELGQPIDSRLIGASRRRQAGVLRLILNASGAFVTVDLPRLSELDEAEWTRLVEHLSDQATAEAPTPFVTDGDRLLPQ